MTLRPVSVFALAALVLALDQGTKHLVAERLPKGQSVPVIPGFFHLTHSVNPGAAFGLLPHQTAFFIVITVAVLGAVLALTLRQRRLVGELAVGLGLAAGGAAGNLVDRLRWGAVVDFLDFRVWPVFNVADVAIVAGAALIAFHVLRAQPAEHRSSWGGGDGGRG